MFKSHKNDYTLEKARRICKQRIEMCDYLKNIVKGPF